MVDRPGGRSTQPAVPPQQLQEGFVFRACATDDSKVRGLPLLLNFIEEQFGARILLEFIHLRINIGFGFQPVCNCGHQRHDLCVWLLWRPSGLD